MSESILEEMQRSVVKAMYTSKDRLIFTAIRTISPEFISLNPDTIAEAGRRGKFVTFPDRTEIFYWDSIPTIKFWPFESTMDGYKIGFTQKYQLLYLVPE